MTKHMKKLFCVLLSALLIAGALPFVSLPEAKAADVWDGTWDGSGFSNNHITSAKGLAQFINNAGTGTSYSGQTVYLDVDIDLNSIDFGNIAGGSIIMGLVYYGLTALSHMIRLQVPILTVGIPAVLSLYFDLFSDFMQAFIFIMLTMVFISNAGPSDDAAET